MRYGETDLDDVSLAASVDRVDGDCEQDECPEDGRRAGDDHALLGAVGGGAKAHVEVDDGGGGQRVERGGQVGHGGGEDGGDQQAGDSGGHLVDDEAGKMRFPLAPIFHELAGCIQVPWPANLQVKLPE